jgi:hypothetical protein
MQAEEFYKIFDEYSKALQDAGFKKKSRNTFENKNVQLKVILNKWGWLEDSGWGFLARLTDTHTISKDPEKPTLPVEQDITPDYLLDEQLVNRSALDAVYAPYSTSQPKMLEMLQPPSWFAFYDIQNLRQVLYKFMPGIAAVATNWSEVQNSDKARKPAQPRKLSKEEMKHNKEELRKALEGLPGHLE